jgi:hypothetical protein
MRSQVTGFQFYIDEETLAGDGSYGNPIRAAAAGGDVVEWVLVASGNGTPGGVPATATWELRINGVAAPGVAVQTWLATVDKANGSTPDVSGIAAPIMSPSLDDVGSHICITDATGRVYFSVSAAMVWGGYAAVSCGHVSASQNINIF